MTLDNSLLSNLTAFESILRKSVQAATIPSARIKEAIIYALFPGGKRLRPALIYLTGQLIELPLPCLHSMAVAVEYIHCYSLIHDDLPAMDNDDYRRGKPSCHKAFDEATAILAGDGLHTLAFDYLLRELPQYIPANQAIPIARELMQACGVQGMISGQSLDLSELNHGAVIEATLASIHFLKTGRLISACINMVLLATPLQSALKDALENFALHLGMAFQMQDDYLDAFASTAILGKLRASDEANNKKTYAHFYNASDLFTLTQHHFEQAKHALQPWGEKRLPLCEFIQTLQHRSLPVKNI